MLAADAELVSIRLEATDLSGLPIDRIVTGESFLVKAYLEDRRGEPGVDVERDVNNNIYDDPQGFFSAYINITYDSAGFEFDPTYEIEAGPTINPVFSIFPDTNTDGFISRIGVANLDLDTSGEEVEIFNFRMIAQAPGDYSMAESFLPHFHFEVLQTNPSTGEPIYVDGVPQLETLTGTDYLNAISSEFIALRRLGNRIHTTDSEVYFEGVDLEVVADTTQSDIEIRFVNSASLISNGERTNLPNDMDYIDEWDRFFVEIYARAPSGNAVQSATIELGYDPNHYQFQEVIDGGDDSQIRYNEVAVESNPAAGRVLVSFTSLFENLGDNDDYALVGRVLLQSTRDVANDTSVGYAQSVESSPINVVSSSTTIVDTSNSSRSVIYGAAGVSGSFDVWPVIYDGDAAENDRVGLNDLAAFVQVFGQTATTPQARKFDFNHDGRVTLNDFSLFVQNYGQSQNSITRRVYPANFPGDWQTVPLMGRGFRLEGEPEPDNLSVPLATSVEAPTSSTPSSSEGPVASYYEPTTTNPVASQVTADATDDSPVEVVASTDPSKHDSATDAALIAASVRNGDSAALLEGEEDSYEQQADQILADWEETLLA